MTLIKYLTATTLALALLMAAMPTIANAQTAEQKQELEQSYEVECTTANYGQGTCKVKGVQTGKQYQRIAIASRSAMYHKPADTAVDTATMAALGAVLTTGVTAAIIKRKMA